VNNSQPNNGEASPIEEESKENPPPQNERFQYINDRDDLQTMHGDLRIRKKKNVPATNGSTGIPGTTGTTGTIGTAGTERAGPGAGTELAEKTDVSKKVESNSDDHHRNLRQTHNHGHSHSNPHTHQRMVIHGQNFYQPSTEAINNNNSNINNRGLGLHRPHHNEMILNNEQNERHHHGHHGHIRPSTANQATQSRESRGVNALRLIAGMQHQPHQSGGGSQQQQQQQRRQQPKKSKNNFKTDAVKF